MEIVADAVHIRGHHRECVEAVLLSISVAHRLAGDLCDRVGQVGFLQRSREQRLLRNRLFGISWIDATRPQEEELACAVPVGGVDDIRLDLEVLPDEIGAVSRIRNDSTDFGGREDDVLGPLAAKKSSTAAWSSSGNSSCVRVTTAVNPSLKAVE